MTPCSLASRYDNPKPWADFIPQSGTKIAATELPVSWCIFTNYLQLVEQVCLNLCEQEYLKFCESPDPEQHSRRMPTHSFIRSATVNIKIT